MLILRHTHLSSEDLITCERVLLRFVAGRAKDVDMDFNVWDHTVPEIYGYILGLFAKLGLIECLGITSGELLDFIVDVDRGYLATFYHSFYHAADVTAVLYHMLQGTGASQYLCKIDMAALLLAGLCHDIGHPGLNNLFQINAKTDLFEKYGEASVLEKYSCSLAMDLVTKHALFRNISKSPTATLPEGGQPTDDSIREAMIKSILATDMAFHYDMLGNLNNLFEALTSPVSSSASESNSDPESEPDDDEATLSPNSSTTTGVRVRVESVRVAQSNQLGTKPKASSPLNNLKESLSAALDTHRGCHGSSCTSSSHSQNSLESESLSSPQSTESTSITPADLTPEQRQTLCNCLLHAADISNAIKPWTACKRWSDLVVQEFFRQGDIEKAQGLPISPNMDRDQQNQSQISLGFGDFVVKPYFNAFVELLPEAMSFLTSLASNRTQWVALQKSSQQFGDDPYLSIDPLEDPSLAKRPSDSDASYIPSGRRVSVAAGVLVLDDTRSLRTPYRRLRHSTNTEAGPVHGLRRMKRSFSGRSLSTSMQNLHAHSERSSNSSSSGKLSSGHEILISALKRQASLTEKEMATLSQPVYINHHPTHSDESADSYFSAQKPSRSPKPVQSHESTTSKSLEQQKNKGISGNTIDSGGSVAPTGAVGGGGGGSFRQKRLASLQVTSPIPSCILQEYGDGYVMQKESTPSENIPNSHDSTSPASTAAKPLQGQIAVASTQAGNRSSTPAVMMSKIKYDWVLSPTLAEAPVESRLNCGPLDDEMNSPSNTAILDTNATANLATNSNPSLSTAATRLAGINSVGRLINVSKSEGSSPVMADTQTGKALPTSDGAVLISTAESPTMKRALK
ncbi:High affinity cAMP-specific and IBMX-insensitive 3',5'-cyclic phosphodiesterase 9A [Entomortierella beljakovae]|nr:High affinity cAMP-specific and IBMX-insensitive 3',5'-cyclic phosphodiesterase 9A [Entomortierella beljakovae]